MATKKIPNEVAKRHAITLEDKLVIIIHHKKGVKDGKKNSSIFWDELDNYIDDCT